MTCIWLNRPAADSAATAQALAAMGVETLIAPLTQIATRAVALEQPPEALLFTSRHAVPAVAPGPMPVFCVGASTAEAARAAGFSNVITGDGDVLSLLPIIADHLRAGSRLTYLSGEDIQVDVTPLLAARGIAVERIVAYEAVAETVLPPALVAAWPAVTGVAFYSARSAAIACALLRDAGLPTDRCDAFCMSLTVAQEAARLPWRSLQAAHVPTSHAMLAMMAHVDS